MQLLYSPDVLESLILFALIIFFQPLFGHVSVTSGIILLLAYVTLVPGLLLIFRLSPPFVPTSRKVLTIMMDLAKIRRGERVYDLGCGDGRVVFAAAERGAIATGYEFSVPTYLIAKFRSLFRRGARIRFRNYWKQDYRNADVVFCFLLTRTMQEFHQLIWPHLKKGCRVISNSFQIEGLIPVEQRSCVFVYVKE